MPDRTGWSEDLATGNPVIDNQHKEIFRRAGLLLDKIRAGGVSDNEIKETVEFLSDYVVEHFGMEEVLQELYNYPSYRAHKDKHDRFAIEFLTLQEKYETGLSADIAARLGNLIVTWLMDHIEKEDKALAAYVRKMAD